MDGRISIATELETKTFDAQIKNLEKKLETMTKTLESEAEIPVHLRMSEEERLNLENDIEKTKNQIISLQQKMSDDKPSEQMSRNLKKSANNMKRFALNLLSVGSLLALVSKASSSYISQNDELAKKLQSVWVGLGAFLAPAIEFISDILLKGIGYLNEFIKALTGVDFIARANAKALEKQASAQGKLNKQTQQYDFDVVRTQQSTSSSGGVSGGSSGLIEIPELNQGIVSKLKDLAEWLKENHKWILAIGGALATYFAGKKIAGILSSFGKLIGGSASGLLGITKLLKGIATIGIISIGVDLIYKSLTGRSLIEDLKTISDGIKGINDTYKRNADSAEKVTKKIDATSEAMLENVKAGKYSEEQLTKLISYNNDMVKSIATQTSALKDNSNWWNIGSTDARRQMEENIKQIDIMTTTYGELYEQGLLNNEQTQIYYEMLFNQIKIMQEAGKNTDDLKAKYKNLTGESYEIVLKAKVKDDATKQLENIFNVAKKLFPNSTIFDKVLGAFGSMNFTSGTGSSAFGGSSSGGIRFAQGGIVTQPTRALIGEAGYPEAVVPMTSDYLSTLANAIGQYSGGNGTTNVYLDGRLIQRQINNKQNKVNFATNR